MRSHILILALASLGACTANFRRDVDTGDGPGDDGNNGTVTIVTSFVSVPPSSYDPTRPRGR
jgi:hypothetical protein